MNLREKLLAAVAFDHKRIRSDHDIDNHSAFAGAKQENARLTRLLTALIDAQELLICWCHLARRSGYEQCTVCDAKAALERAVGDEKPKPHDDGRPGAE
jgi:hypothetical protein